MARRSHQPVVPIALVLSALTALLLLTVPAEDIQEAPGFMVRTPPSLPPAASLGDFLGPVYVRRSSWSSGVTKDVLPLLCPRAHEEVYTLRLPVRIRGWLYSIEDQVRMKSHIVFDIWRTRDLNAKTAFLASTRPTFSVEMAFEMMLVDVSRHWNNHQTEWLWKDSHFSPSLPTECSDL